MNARFKWSRDVEAGPQISGCWACGGRSSSSQEKGPELKRWPKMHSETAALARLGQWLSHARGHLQCLSTSRLHTARTRDRCQVMTVAMAKGGIAGVVARIQRYIADLFRTATVPRTRPAGPIEMRSGTAKYRPAVMGLFPLHMVVTSESAGREQRLSDNPAQHGFERRLKTRL